MMRRLNWSRKPSYSALCLRFAKKCLGNEKVANIFPIKKQNHKMKKRKVEKFKVNKGRTTRYRKSTVPFMQKLLNDEFEKKRQFLKN